MEKAPLNILMMFETIESSPKSTKAPVCWEICILACFSFERKIYFIYWTLEYKCQIVT